MSGARRARMCHCSLEASPSSGISSVHLFTAFRELVFLGFSSGLTETRERSVGTWGRHQSL